MLLNLSETQKLKLILIFLELEVDQVSGWMKQPQPEDFPVSPPSKINKFKATNQRLKDANINIQVDETPNEEYLFIQEQLMSFIYNNISGEEFYTLLKKSFDILNEKYQFDSNGKLLRPSYCFALEKAINNYHDRENKTSHNKALRETLLLCLFIVTIPFAKLIYNSRHEEHAKKHFFQSLFIPDDILVNGEKFYGLLNKNHRDSEKNFKTVVFNKKDNIRKFMTASEAYGGKRKGGFFLSTKAQIESSSTRYLGSSGPSTK